MKASASALQPFGKSKEESVHPAGPRPLKIVLFHSGCRQPNDIDRARSRLFTAAHSGLEGHGSTILSLAVIVRH